LPVFLLGSNPTIINGQVATNAVTTATHPASISLSFELAVHLLPLMGDLRTMMTVATTVALHYFDLPGFHGRANRPSTGIKRSLPDEVARRGVNHVQPAPSIKRKLTGGSL
jgi:hypothetical protein